VTGVLVVAVVAFAAGWGCRPRQRPLLVIEVPAGVTEVRIVVDDEEWVGGAGQDQ
jgi:hypothetical protein